MKNLVLKSTLPKHGLIAISLFFLAACDLANSEGKIGKLNHGLVLWAVENVPTDRTDEIFSTLPNAYLLVPGLLPLKDGKLPAAEETIEVDSVYIAPPDETFVRNGNTQVRWYTTAVYDTSKFALAFFMERGFFEANYFAVTHRIHIARESGTSENDNVYVLVPDAPIITVNRGEAVYVGTFTATLTPGERGALGTRRSIREVRRSYRVDRADAEGIIREIKLDPKRLRIQNIFENYPVALERYSKPTLA